MEIPVDQEPAEGEVLIFTIGGGFVVKGTLLEVAQKLTAEEWCHFELAESGDRIIIHAPHVIGLRGGQKPKHRAIGFTSRE